MVSKWQSRDRTTFIGCRNTQNIPATLSDGLRDACDTYVQNELGERTFICDGNGNVVKGFAYVEPCFI